MAVATSGTIESLNGGTGLAALGGTVVISDPDPMSAAHEYLFNFRVAGNVTFRIEEQESVDAGATWHPTRTQNSGTHPGTPTPTNPQIINQQYNGCRTTRWVVVNIHAATLLTGIYSVRRQIRNEARLP